MKLLIAIAAILTFILYAVLFVYLARNAWVYKKRVSLLDENFNEYSKLITYNEMMRKWWVWDIEKLKKHD